jgi:NitT/TauT family transport system permease protein
MAYLFSFGILLGTWYAGTLFFGATLVPPPTRTLACLAEMSLTLDFWANIAITIFRGVLALAISVTAALGLGIAAGRSRLAMALTGPLVAALQASPPILWITLLMVWVGTGSRVPVTVVAASLLPPLFATVAQSAAAIDHRLFELAAVYRVKRTRILTDILLRGIYPYFLAGFSYALGTCWKIAAVAEFLGSSRGIGARIYWAYRMLKMPELFAWATVLVGLGMAVELGLIRPLRERAETGTHA